MCVFWGVGEGGERKGWFERATPTQNYPVITQVIIQSKFFNKLGNISSEILTELTVVFFKLVQKPVK